MIPHWARITAEQVGVEVHRSRQFRRGRQRQFRLAIFNVQVARQNRLPFLDDVNVSGASLQCRENFHSNGISRSVNRAFRAQQDLVLPSSRLQRHAARRAISFPIRCFHRESLRSRARFDSNHRHSAVVRRRALVGVVPGLNRQLRSRRCSIRIRSEQKDLVLQTRDERATFRNRGDQQRRFANGDWFSAALCMPRGVFHCDLDEHPRCSLAQRPSRKVPRQLQVEFITSVAIGLPLHGPNFKYRHVHAGSLYADFCSIHRLPKKVIRSHRALHMIAWPVAPLRFLPVSRELHRHLEFRQNVSLDVQCDLRHVWRRRFGFAQQRAQVVSAQVHFIGQREFCRSNSKLVGLRRFFEHLVAARIFHLKRQLPIGSRFVIGAVQRQRPHVYGLAWLIDGFFRREQDGNLVF